MSEEKNNDLASQIGRAAGRLSSDPELRKRILRAGASGVAASAGSVARAGKTLWLEVMGFLFLCLAVIGGAEVVRKWQSHETEKLALATVFAVMFGYFGASSFWRAKKIKTQHKEQRHKGSQRRSE